MTVFEKPVLNNGGTLRAMILLTCGLLVQGCANGLPHYSGPKKVPTEQAAVSNANPLAATNTVKPKKRTSVKRTATSIPARKDIALSVTYMVRILVPAGSELTVSAAGAGGSAPSIKTTKTQSGPPYVIDLPVDTAEDAYPMTVNATLTSKLGHVLTGNVVLQERPSASVEITMSPKS